MRSTPYPLPEGLLATSPADLAAAAVRSLQRVYALELDYSLASLSRLDLLLQEQFRAGHYTAADYPAALALTLGAYVGETLLRHSSGGRWGQADENLYGTPLPFLVFADNSHERELIVVEDLMTYFWTGEGLLPREYYDHHLAELQRLGYVPAADAAPEAR